MLQRQKKKFAYAITFAVGALLTVLGVQKDAELVDHLSQQLVVTKVNADTPEPTDSDTSDVSDDFGDISDNSDYGDYTPPTGDGGDSGDDGDDDGI